MKTKSNHLFEKNKTKKSYCVQESPSTSLNSLASQKFIQIVSRRHLNINKILQEHFCD